MKGTSCAAIGPWGLGTTEKQLHHTDPICNQKSGGVGGTTAPDPHTGQAGVQHERISLLLA